MSSLFMMPLRIRATSRASLASGYCGTPSTLTVSLPEQLSYNGSFDEAAHSRGKNRHALSPPHDLRPKGSSRDVAGRAATVSFVLRANDGLQRSTAPRCGTRRVAYEGHERRRDRSRRRRSERAKATT